MQQGHRYLWNRWKM